MIGYQISKLSWEDIPDIHDLYREIYADAPHRIKSLQELEWLYADPHKKSDFLGYKARTHAGEIAGVIGYSLNKYRIGNTEIKGAIPMSWIVAPAHRGLLGLQLLKKVMNEGDFGFALHGSYEAQQSYSAVRLKYSGSAGIYTKVLKPVPYIKSEKSISVKSILKACYLWGRKKHLPDHPIISLKAGAESSGIHHFPVEHLTMIPEANRNAWLDACPEADMLSYTLYQDGREKGPALCYISDTNEIKRGRIVHIPYMGDDLDSYQQAIGILEEELISHGCCSINALAMQSSSRKAFIRQGYKTYRNSMRALYVYDPGRLLEEADLKQWYLSFYESDKGYRDI